MNKKILILTALIFVLNNPCFALVRDELADALIENEQIQPSQAVCDFNFESLKRIPVSLSIISDIPSEKAVHEGDIVYFEAKSDVYYKNQKIIKKNERVQARVETIIKSGMNGIPASIIFGSFKFENIDNSRVTYSYEKFGMDRSLWVFPLKWALTPLPPTGSLTNFIKGGHAKMKADEIITIYYYPEW